MDEVFSPIPTEVSARRSFGFTEAKAKGVDARHNKLELRTVWTHPIVSNVPGQTHGASP